MPPYGLSVVRGYNWGMFKKNLGDGEGDIMWGGYNMFKKVIIRGYNVGFGNLSDVLKNNWEGRGYNGYNMFKKMWEVGGGGIMWGGYNGSERQGYNMFKKNNFLGCRGCNMMFKKNRLGWGARWGPSLTWLEEAE
ncbi:hypothetical protein DPMN_132748 [Dreissena polymorpha]|uniref:Uncharacterized protein n=1 Tax=Dreissena polymorpha TaxID=45954 RepID=A0A9D4FTZ0_DREPO|nr:hypothetical protein DPMN_132748 [Dreissena polymorpha]